ncbi:MAG: hydrolase TatD [Deltaproteobacteria bacterium]|nr:MAG: hydrolase TatD [Deltaproteobacteria bacterium]
MWIDTHAHLDMEVFQKDLESVLKRAEDNGVEAIVTVGVDLRSSQDAVQLANTRPNLYAAVGLHPHEAGSFNSMTLETLATLSQDPKVVAWGEIGLDYYRNYSPRELQRKAFEEQLHIAIDLGLPIIIHDREAHEDILDILRKIGKRERFGVVHCYSGDMELAQQLFDMGFFISIPGTITYKNAAQIRQVAASAPINRILIETDAPFLAPVPYRGKRNEPAYVAITAQELAKLRKLNETTLAGLLRDNTKKLFGI